MICRQCLDLEYCLLLGLIKKSDALLLLSDGKPCLTDGLCWGKGGITYLGVYLGDDRVLQKNWEWVLEKVKVRLDKWKWLLPNMSYRMGFFVFLRLIINILSTGYYRNRCSLGPSGLYYTL